MITTAQRRMLLALRNGPLEGAVLLNDYGPSRRCPEHLAFATADRTLTALELKGFVAPDGDGLMAAEWALTDRGRRWVEKYDQVRLQ